MKCPRCGQRSRRAKRLSHHPFGVFSDYKCRSCGLEWRRKTEWRKGFVLSIPKIFTRERRTRKTRL